MLINIKRPHYTMASVNDTDAEVSLYGDIVEEQPTDWYGNPAEGQYIIGSEFLKDLEQIAKCKNVLIRMNSYGGDAGVSVMIHNRLRELAREGVNLTCVVDGVAMSGGSLIMCACDHVQVNPSSLIMIHKCWAFVFGGYNADELRDLAQSNDAYDKSQVAIYERKTGLSGTVLMHMMADTTYLTGKEAVEKGFADELLEDGNAPEIAASADRNSLMVAGRTIRLIPGMTLPNTIPTITPVEASAGIAAPTPDDTNKSQPAKTGNEGGNNPMTLEELKRDHPDLVAQIADEVAAIGADNIDAAVQGERDRIQEIDGIAALYSPEMVHEAKYGKNACTAQELAFRAAQEQAKTGSTFMQNLTDDNNGSGGAEVGAAPAADDAAGGKEVNTIEQARADAKAYNERKKEAR